MLNAITYDADVNPVLWILSNLLTFYVAIVMIVFVAFYGLAFKWWIRPAGVSIFVFTASLMGVIALVVIGTFVNPRQPWYVYPPDVFIWRPALRFLIYVTVAIAATNLLWTAFQRWRHTDPLTLDIDPRTRPRDRLTRKRRTP